MWAYAAVVSIAAQACCFPCWGQLVLPEDLQICHKGGEHLVAVCGELVAACAVDVQVGEDTRADA
jgi:hypothetical protein